MHKIAVYFLMMSAVLETKVSAEVPVADAPTLSATESAPEGGSGAIAEVIVTAQKRAERLSDVPLSLTAASGDTLKELGVSSAADLAKVVPGFTFAKSAYGAPIFTIRGIGFYDEAIAIAPTVSIYLDQVPIPFSRMAEGASLDLERLEVLKGPQGTLFGQNSTGGAINYIAAKPTQEFHFGGDLGYGRFNATQAQGYVSGGIANGLAARLSGRFERSDGWQQSETSNRTLGGRNFATGRLLVDWNPGEQLKVEFNLNGWKDRSDSQAPQYRKYSAITPTSNDGPDPRYNGFTGSPAQPNLDAALRTYPVVNDDRAADWDRISFQRDDVFYQGALRADYALTDRLTLTSISAYSDLRINSPVDFDGTEYLDGRNQIVGAIHSLGQELRLSGSAGPEERLNFMLGGNYQHDETHDNQLITFDGTNTGLFKGTPFEYRYAGSGIDNQSNQRITTEAAFGSLDYRLPHALTAQASMRYTKDERIFDGCLRDKGDGIFSSGFGLLSNVLHGIFTIPDPGSPSYIPPGGCATFEGDQNSPNLNYPVDNVHTELPEHNISWRGGLSWKPVEDAMLYANVTRGFKSGSFGTLPYLTNVQVQPIKQEELTAYEVGFKGFYLEHKIELAGAAFHYSYKNKQLLGYLYTGAIFGNLPGEVSIPESRVNGAELSAAFRPLTGLMLDMAATMIDSKVTGDYRTASPDALYGFQPSTDPSCPPGSTIGSCGVNIKGSHFTYTPKWNLLADAQYTFPIASNWNTFIGANVVYRSSTLAAFAGPPDGTPRSEAYTTASDYELPSYPLLDLRLGFETTDGKYRVQLWGQNVTNKYYWIHVVKIQDTLARITGQPTTFGVTLSAQY